MMMMMVSPMRVCFRFSTFQIGNASIFMHYIGGIDMNRNLQRPAAAKSRVGNPDPKIWTVIKNMSRPDVITSRVTE